jgi:hypothetical protein
VQQAEGLPSANLAETPTSSRCGTSGAEAKKSNGPLFPQDTDVSAFELFEQERPLRT